MKEKGISDTEIALLAVPFSISLMVSNSVFGRLSDTYGRKPFLLLGLILSSISSGLYIFPFNLWTFSIARIFNGIALGIFPSSVIGMASDRNLKLGWLSSFGSIGWAFGGLLGGLLADVYSLDFIFLYSSFMYFSAFILSIFLKKNADDIEQELERKNNHIDYRKVIRENWVIYLLLISRHGTANAIWIFWPIFLSEQIGLSTSQIGVIQATNMFTQFIFMRLVTDKIDPRKLYFVGCVFSAIAFFSFTVVNNFEFMIITQIILGFSWAFFYVGGLRRVETKSKPLKSVATGTGLFNSSISIAQIVGPFIALILLQFDDPFILTMRFAAIITFSSALIYGFYEIYIEPKNQSKLIVPV